MANPLSYWIKRSRRNRPAATRRKRPSQPGSLGHLESLENRAMMWVAATYGSGVLNIDITGSDNSVAFDFQTFSAIDANKQVITFIGGLMTTSSNPDNQTFSDLSQINIVVANPDTAANNRVSFNLLPGGAAFTNSSFVFEGNGTTGSGLFSCEVTDNNAKFLDNVGLNLTNVDSISFSQANEIRLDGVFSNDTNDATVLVNPGTGGGGATGQAVQTQVFLGTNRPLQADSVQVNAARALSILNDITGNDSVVLRASVPLDLPFDISAGSTLVLDGSGGVVQRVSSTITAPVLEVINRVNPNATGGDIDLSSPANDFNKLRIQSFTDGKVGVVDVDNLTIDGYGILAATGQVVLNVGGALVFDAPIQASGLVARSGDSIVSTAMGSMTLGDLGLTLEAQKVTEDATGNIILNGPITIGTADLTKRVNNRIRARGITTIAGGLISRHGGTTLIESDAGIVISSPIQVGSSELSVNSDTLTVQDADLTLVSSVGGITILDTPGNDAIPQTIQVTNILSLDASDDITIGGSLFAGTIYGNPSALTASQALPAITVKGDSKITITQTGSLTTKSYENNPDTQTNPLLGLISIDAGSSVTQAGTITADGQLLVTAAADVSVAGASTARSNLIISTNTGSIDLGGAIRSVGGTYTTSQFPTTDPRTPNVTLAAPLGSISTSGDGSLTAGKLIVNGTTTYGTVSLTAQQDVAIAAPIDTPGAVNIESKLGSFQLSTLLRNTNGATVTISAANGIGEAELGGFTTPGLILVNTGLSAPSVPTHIAISSTLNQIQSIAARNFSLGGSIRLLNSSDIALGRIDAPGGALVTNGGEIIVKVTGQVSSSDAIQVITGAAPSDISVTATGYLALRGNVSSTTGDVTIASAADTVATFGPVDAATITVSAGTNIGVFAPMLAREGDVTVTASEGTLLVGGNIASTKGDINLSSREFVQGGRGISSVQIVDRPANATNGTTYRSGSGSGYTAATQVTVAPPRNGGIAPVVKPIIGDYQARDDQGQVINDTLIIYDNNGKIQRTLEVPRIVRNGILGFTVLSPGSGYLTNEEVTVTIFDPAATAPAYASVTLETTSRLAAIRADAGAVTVTATTGNLAASTIAAAGDITLEASRQSASISDGSVSTLGGDVYVKAGLDASTLGTTIAAKNGSIVITAGRSASAGEMHAASDISVTGKQDVRIGGRVIADDGVATFTGSGGSATIVADVDANQISVSSRGDLGVTGPLLARKAGGIDLASDVGTIALGTSVSALEGDISLKSGSLVAAGRGLASIQVGAQGQGYGSDVRVTIAPPRNGGIAATAVANLGQVQKTDKDGNPVIDPATKQPVYITGAITGFTITNPGFGYVAGEQPSITLSGSNGSSATATSIVGNTVLSSTIYAQKGKLTATTTAGTLSILSAIAGSDITLTSTRDIFSLDSDLNSGGAVTLSAGGQLTAGAINADGAIDLESINDLVATKAIRSINSGLTVESSLGAVTLTGSVGTKEDITITGFGVVGIVGPLNSQSGKASVASVSSDIAVAANIEAEAISLDAHASLIQGGYGIDNIALVPNQSGYSGRGFNPATTTISISPPQFGGISATALVTSIGDVFVRDSFGRIQYVYNSGNYVPLTVPGSVTGIQLVNPGLGYQPGEEVTVAITDPNSTEPAIAKVTGLKRFTSQFTSRTGDTKITAAYGGLVLQGIKSGNDITLTSGLDLSTADAAVVAAGKVTVTSERSATIGVTTANDDITITANAKVSVQGSVRSESGDVTLESKSASVAINAGIDAQGILGTARTDFAVLGTLLARSAGININSTIGTLAVGSDVSALAGDIDLTGANVICAGRGLSGLTIGAKGSGYSSAGTNVTISPPKNGGVAAIANATIGSYPSVDKNGNPILDPTTKLPVSVQGGVIGLTLVNPGLGYVLGETVTVTLTDPNSKEVATATATVGSAILSANIYAKTGDVRVTSTVGNVSLRSATADAGSLTISSARAIQAASSIFKVGDSVKAQAGSGIDVGLATALNQISLTGVGSLNIFGKLLAQDPASSAILLTSSAGGIVTYDDVDAGGNIGIDARDNVGLLGRTISRSGEVDLTSRTGTIAISSDVLAQEDISMSARSGVVQGGYGIQELTLDSTNRGSGYTIDTATISISPPKNGGIAATGAITAVTNDFARDATGNVILDSQGQPVRSYPGTITGISLLNPGLGYYLGETVTVSISDPNATLVAQASAKVGKVFQPTLHSTAGTISATTQFGIVSLQKMIAGGAIQLLNNAGRIEVTQPIYADSLVANSADTATLDAISTRTNIEITSRNDLSLLKTTTSDAGSITLTSSFGRITSNGLLDGDSITATSAGDLLLLAQSTARTGDISLEATEGNLLASDNLTARQGDISLKAQKVIQGGRGIASFTVTKQGAGYTREFTTVTVSPPRNGGVAATATVIFGSYLPVDAQGNPLPGADLVQGGITNLILLTPGSGYEEGEPVTVTIFDPNATAQASATGTVESLVRQSAFLAPSGKVSVTTTVGDANLQQIIAGSDVTLTIKNDLNGDAATLRSDKGDITISVGNVSSLGSVTAPNGDITIEAVKDAVFRNDVLSENGAVSLKSDFASLTTFAQVRGGSIAFQAGTNGNVLGVVRASSGNVDIKNPSGTLATGGNIYADKGNITVSAAELVQGRRGIGALTIALDAQGENYSLATTTVTISPPRNGGVAATARVSIGRYFLRDANGNFVLNGNSLVPIYGGITGIQLLTPGSGYDLDEPVTVTIYDPNATQYAKVTATVGTTLRTSDFFAPKGLISAETTAGSMTILGMYAMGDITLRSSQAVTSQSNRRVASIQLLSGGAGYNAATVVTISPPARGGDPATATATVSNGVITGLTLVSGGTGYLPGETVTVTFSGSATIPAQARVILDTSIQSGIVSDSGKIDVSARTGDIDFSAARVQAVDGSVTIKTQSGSLDVARIEAAGDITLSSTDTLTGKDTLSSDAGGISFTSTHGNIDLASQFLFVTAPKGKVSLAALGGSATLQRARAGNGFDAQSQATFTLLNRLNVTGGDVSLLSTNGDLDFSSPAAQIFAAKGAVTLTSLNGQVITPPVLNVFKDVIISSYDTVQLINSITSQTGKVGVTSTSGGVTLSSNVISQTSSIAIAAKGSVTQTVGTGLNAVNVTSGGSGYTAGTTVTIAAPKNGGTAATAVAVLGTVNGVAGVITAITITNAGSGYAVGESPAVTITPPATGAAGAGGARAVAIGPTGVQNLTANTDISIDAGTGVTLVNALNATNGDVTIRTVNGNVEFSGGSALVSAQKGNVLLSSINGTIVTPPVLNVAGNIDMRAFGPLTIANQLTTGKGNITLAVSGSSLNLASKILSATTVDISAKTGINQTDGFIKAVTLKAANATASPITLGSSTNDVDMFAATNIGAVTYVDADEFRVGTKTSGQMGVEVTGSVVSLSSLAENSVIRVVAGINYRRLFIAAGTQGGTAVGTVEFVTTNPADNPGRPFAGTLRDMIQYVTDNRSTYQVNASTLSQPMKMVFDEPGYTVGEILVSSALPAFGRPVFFDGSRVNSTVTAGRLGIRGSSNAASGLYFGDNSSGSTVNHTALYGFTRGSALLIESARNTVQDTYVGIKADGRTSSTNLVGVNISGTGATLNTIGSSVFDATTANRFASNTDAAILIQRSAARNRVFGNLIGSKAIQDLTGVAGLTTNCDGVRIDNAIGNVIGSSDEVTPALTPTTSNYIEGNKGAGIFIKNSAGNGTAATANVVQNNLIAANQSHGVNVTASSGVTLGGGDLWDANVIVTNSGSGVYLFNASSVDISGNSIGVDKDLLARLGNKRAGIEIAASSNGVAVDGNRISANNMSGIAITSKAKNITITDNVIGGVLNTIAGLQVVDGGSGYTTAPAVTISAPIADCDGRAATAVAVVNNGVVTGLILTDAGKGYSSDEEVYVTFEGASTTQAVAKVVWTSAGNGADGVLITNSNGNTVGAGNRISFNKGSGVSVVGANAESLADGNKIYASEIFNNATHGIQIGGSTRVTIGGYKEDAVNLIYSNTLDGIRVEGHSRSRFSPTGNVILGNHIGTNEFGDVDASLGNRNGIVISRGVSNVITNNMVMNNSQNGIEVRGGGLNVIGGETLNAGNYIAFNKGDGIQVADQLTASVSGLPVGVPTNTTRVSISGNEITANGRDGVRVSGSKAAAIFIGQNLTGTAVTGLANDIHGNEGRGVVVDGAQRVSTQGNTIYENGLGAIDVRNQGNGFAAFKPLFDSATVKVIPRTNAQIQITGRMYGEAYQRYSIDVYANDSWDGSFGDNGKPVDFQMRTFIGRTVVTADANGLVNFNFTVDGKVALGDVLTLTATSLLYGPGSTSALSDGVLVTLLNQTTPSKPSPVPAPGSVPATSSGNGGAGGTGGTSGTGSGTGGPVPPSQRP